jgi:hypothetical protein
MEQEAGLNLYELGSKEAMGKRRKACSKKKFEDWMY